MIDEDKKEITEKEMAVNNFNVVLKNIDELVPDEDNEHKPEDITEESIAELKASILAVGLLQNFAVQAHSNKLIGGHRRLAALKELVAEGHKEFQFAPCVIKDYDRIDIKGLSFKQKEDYGRIICNQQAEFSPGELMKSIRTLEDIYKSAREAGDERFKGFSRSRDFVAKELNIATATLSRLKSIDSKATEKVKEALEEKLITQEEALTLTKESAEVQDAIIEKKISEEAAEPKSDYNFTSEDDATEEVVSVNTPTTTSPSVAAEPAEEPVKVEVLKRADEAKLNKIRKLAIEVIDAIDGVELDAIKAIKVNQALDSIISNFKKISDIYDI